MSDNICLTECKNECCQNLFISLTHFDVQRILKYKKNYDVFDIIKFYYEVNISGLVRIKTRENIYVMGINMDKLDGNVICVFNKSRKCTIYKSRPLLCRTYPFCYNENGYIVLATDIKCPRKWNDSHIAEAQKNIAQLLKERLFFLNRVKWWNTYCSHLSLDEFAEYIFDDLPTEKRNVTEAEAIEFTISLRLKDYIQPLSNQQIIELLCMENLKRQSNIIFNKLNKRSMSQLKSFYRKVV